MKFQLNSQDLRFGFGASSNAVVKFPGLGIPTAPVGAAAVGDYSDTTLGNVGTSGDFGYDSPAVSQWDVVPMQEVVEYPYVGLVAFHVNNIDKVEFSLNGGAWTEVTEMAENPSTGLYEYCVRVDSSSLQDDDEIELRAKITPLTAGQVYGIDPITIKYNYAAELTGWCAPDGSDSTGDATEENPCRTPHRALQLLVGSTAYTEKITINCKAGEYVPANSAYAYNPPSGSGWLTIKAAPGVDASSVIFRTTIDSGSISYAGIRTLYTKYQNVRFECTVGSRDFSGQAQSTNVWLDNVTVSLSAASGTANNVWQSNTWLHRYATSCTFQNLANGPKFSDLLRGCTVSNMIADAIGGSRLSANMTITDQIEPDGVAHPDVLEVFDSLDHSIFYNVVGLDLEGQGIFVATEELLSENIAFVNCLIVLDSGVAIDGPPASQIRNTEVNTLALRNILIDSCTILNGQTFIVDEGSSPSVASRDLVLRNSILFGPSSNLVSSPADPSDALQLANNWFIDDDGNFACVGGTFSTTTATYSSVADLVPTEAGIVGQAVRPDIKTDARGILRTTNNIGALG